MKERKKELRKSIAQKKGQYAASTLRELSGDILEQLEVHPTFQSAKTILLYFSMEDEVHTHAFIEKWSVQKNILLPVVVGNDLELRTYTGFNNLVTGAYNIKEPSGSPFTDYPSINLVVVPGVAFDAAGHRLGRGKGYYDRLLPQLPACRIGICFPFQLLSEVPSETFDIRMDEVISRKQYW